MPVTTGFIKAVKLALSLNIPVKLEVGQPDVEMIEELEALARFYLHHQTVSQPMESFIVCCWAFIWTIRASLWKIQEEDPDAFGYFDDAGKNHFSRRLAGYRLPQEMRDYITGNLEKLPSASGPRRVPIFEILRRLFQVSFR